MMFGATADGLGRSWLDNCRRNGNCWCGDRTCGIHTRESGKRAEGNRASHTAATESQLKGEKCTSVE